MNWEKVANLVKECAKSPPTAFRPRRPLGPYEPVFSKFNGLEGFVAGGAHLQLWPAEEIDDLNAGYQVDVFAPGLILIGTNGGGEGYGIDLASNRFVSVPLFGMSRNELIDLGATFEEFLMGLPGLS